MAPIAEGATISDVVRTLADPEEYIRRVLGNMHEWKQLKGDAYVRIGATGQAIVPHYLVGPSSDIFDFDKALQNSDLRVLAAALDERSRAFDGRTHKRKDWSFLEIKDRHWSKGQMSYAEVQSLLGEIRGFKRKAR